jgi:hypothetical protein
VMMSGVKVNLGGWHMDTGSPCQRNGAQSIWGNEFRFESQPFCGMTRHRSQRTLMKRTKIENATAAMKTRLTRHSNHAVRHGPGLPAKPRIRQIVATTDFSEESGAGSGFECGLNCLDHTRLHGAQTCLVGKHRRTCGSSRAMPRAGRPPIGPVKGSGAKEWADFTACKLKVEPEPGRKYGCIQRPQFVRFGLHEEFRPAVNWG